ncbi:hypothetical protein RF11_06195 [Thelohanellus kitauei]|uniref:Uncharacterized protein n=1 Tax=Thelohanellus kitauei TaxID=669202 RepID=A0A0C2MH64_THEKT|nr:hypothetical protein RF11_06195 [Thelohanellus kitauei]
MSPVELVDTIYIESYLNPYHSSDVRRCTRDRIFGLIGCYYNQLEQDDPKEKSELATLLSGVSLALKLRKKDESLAKTQSFMLNAINLKFPDNLFNKFKRSLYELSKNEILVIKAFVSFMETKLSKLDDIPINDEKTLLLLLKICIFLVFYKQNIQNVPSISNKIFYNRFVSLVNNFKDNIVAKNFNDLIYYLYCCVKYRGVSRHSHETYLGFSMPFLFRIISFYDPTIHTKLERGYCIFICVILFKFHQNTPLIFRLLFLITRNFEKFGIGKKLNIDTSGCQNPADFIKKFTTCVSSL